MAVVARLAGSVSNMAAHSCLAPAEMCSQSYFIYIIYLYACVYMCVYIMGGSRCVSVCVFLYFFGGGGKSVAHGARVRVSARVSE